MNVAAKDLNADKLRKLQFLVGECLVNEARVYFADYGVTWDGVKQWLVYNAKWGMGSCGLYTTNEMKESYRSIRDDDGTPIPAPHEVKEKLLAQAGLMRMRLKNGCPGCLKLWKFPIGLDRCTKCRRCSRCCLNGEVRHSCESRIKKRRRYVS